MTTFTLNAHDWDQAKGPCCGVLACAVAAQKPFKDAWAWFKNFGGKRYKHHSWKGRTFTADYAGWFKHAGVKYENLMPGKITLSSFMLYKAKPNVPYFVVTTGHAQILFNNKVIDQRGAVNILEYWGAKKFIKEVFEIKVPNKAWQELGLPLFDHFNN